MRGKRRDAGVSPPRWMRVARAFVVCCAVGAWGNPRPAHGHENRLEPGEQRAEALTAPLQTASAPLARIDTPPRSVASRAGAAPKRASRQQVGRGAARFAARINAALRRDARRRSRAHASHARWVAQALAELRTKNVRRVDRLAREAGVRHAVPVALIRAVILVESRYEARAMSPVGAMGLMQLMPATAAELAVRNPLDARQNVFGGARLLRVLGDTFADPVLAIAAYNAGATAVRRYGGVPPYRETQQYVGRVLRAYQHYRAQRSRS